MNNTAEHFIRHFFAAAALLGTGLLATASGHAASPAKPAPLYATDFANGAAGWTVTGGTFAMADGAYRSRAVVEDKKLSRAIVGEKTWQDYRVTARIKLEQAANKRADYGLVARYQDPNNYYIFLYKTDAKKCTIETKIKGKLKTLAEVPLELSAGRWHDFQVTVVGVNLSLTVDDRPVASVTHSEFPGGAAGLLAFWADIQCNRFEVVSVEGTKPGPQ
ncbi:MAG: hypothetical protein Q8N18_21575 [Opitutaceae bacterium]|nr:hypothetical protein [Opitutaceae bacterium]